MSIDFRASLDPKSMSEIVQMYGFQAILDPEVQYALKEISQMLARRAEAKTWEVFANPTGELASTIEADTTSPYEAQVVVGSPYGRRRELGFSGMTDALGRFYPNDPGKPYLAPTVDEGTQESLGMIEQAIQLSLGRIAQ